MTCPKCYPVQAKKEGSTKLCREHELEVALRQCQTLTPSLMDGEAAKERLKEINRHVYAVFGQ